MQLGGSPSAQGEHVPRTGSIEQEFERPGLKALSKRTGDGSVPEISNASDPYGPVTVQGGWRMDIFVIQNAAIDTEKGADGVFQFQGSEGRIVVNRRVELRETLLESMDLDHLPISERNQRGKGSAHARHDVVVKGGRFVHRVRSRASDRDWRRRPGCAGLLGLEGRVATNGAANAGGSSRSRVRRMSRFSSNPPVEGSVVRVGKGRAWV
ncbi:hypothetical protein FB451DRAFT_1185162 [Mycena latifolia]|nr:hypothetical protein FB451DRAFT_1185162 [Mycena latifolia]